MIPKDWTLLVINASSPRALQPVQLQKSLFLLGRNLSAEKLRTPHFYAFSAYDYGPFSSDVYMDAEALADEGLVEIQHPANLRYKLFKVTEAGMVRATDIAGELDEEIRGYLSAIVSFTISLTFDQLVKAIYDTYPDMKVNSVFER